MSTTAMGASLISGRIGNFMYANSRELERSYTKIASGKNITSVADGAGDYIRSDTYTIRNKAYSNITREVDQATAVINYSESANQMIWDDLNDMKGLIKNYYRSGVSENEKFAIKTEFEAVKQRITQTQENATWDGKKVLQDSSNDPLFSFRIDPTDLDNEFRITFDANKVVDVAGLDIEAGETTALDDLEGQVERAGSYGAQLSGYRHGLNAQRKLAETIHDSNEKTVSNIQDIDDAQELFKLNRQSIQQNAARSFFAQNSMQMSSVLSLVASL